LGRRVIGITGAQLAALEKLAPALEPDTYLAGGVAIATAFGHRASLDLDLFVSRDFDPERLEERVAAAESDVRVTGRARGTLHLEVGTVPVSILSYRYPLLAPTERRLDIPVPIASLEDLACMKVSAIAGRGAAKDFWDLFVLLGHGVAGGTLESLLASYARKFPIEDIGHAIRSMAYFADADAAPLPLGLSPVFWAEIKRTFAAWVRAL
jgi:Nucleotidyl transferase AbiEii toxin, Type IV TA system